MTTSTIADKFCKMVASDPSMSNATAKLGAWLIGAAARTADPQNAKAGGFPIELTMHKIRLGFERNGTQVEGMGGRYETIKAGLEWLEEQGYLTSSDGPAVGFGFTSKKYSIHL